VNGPGYEGQVRKVIGPFPPTGGMRYDNERIRIHRLVRGALPLEASP
jgi:hypothetical protein